MGKSGGRPPLGTPGLRWEDNIKMDLKETWYGGHGVDSSGSG
jgi:hypothetical protein